MPNRCNRERGRIGQTWEEGEGESRRERRMESERGRVHLTRDRARITHAAVSFPMCRREGRGCVCEEGDFSTWIAEQFQLSSNIAELLTEQAFDCETAILGLSEENLKELEGLKLGDRAVLQVTAVSLQSMAGGSPFGPVSPRLAAAIKCIYLNLLSDFIKLNDCGLRYHDTKVLVLSADLFKSVTETCIHLQDKCRRKQVLEFCSDFNHTKLCKKMHICFVVALCFSSVPIIHPPCLVCWFGNFCVAMSAIFAAYKLVLLI